MAKTNSARTARAARKTMVLDTLTAERLGRAAYAAAGNLRAMAESAAAKYSRFETQQAYDAFRKAFTSGWVAEGGSRSYAARILTVSGLHAALWPQGSDGKPLTREGRGGPRAGAGRKRKTRKASSRVGADNVAVPTSARVLTDDEKLILSAAAKGAAVAAATIAEAIAAFKSRDVEYFAQLVREWREALAFAAAKRAKV